MLRAFICMYMYIRDLYVHLYRNLSFSEVNLWMLELVQQLLVSWRILLLWTLVCEFPVATAVISGNGSIYNYLLRKHALATNVI